MNNRGFSLLELVVVVIIIGLLSSIAWPRYIRVVEKGRTAEARNVLGMIRSAETSYQFENNIYSTSLPNMGLSTVPTSCNANNFFSYVVTGGGAVFTATATRCTSGGKAPQGPSNYQLMLNETGALFGDPAFL
jgi:type IV pilus assembly protein PilE